MTWLRTCLYELGQPTLPRQPCLPGWQYKSVYMSRASQVCQASPPYRDNKKSVYMTRPLSRDEFLSTLTCTVMAFSSRQGGMACLYGKSSCLGNQDLAYNDWDLGKRARLAALINSMVNFTEILGDAETPSKAGCPGKPNWPGSHKQALNKPCVIFKVLHSSLSVLTLKSEKMLEQCQCFFPCLRLCNLFLLTEILIILLIVIVNGSQICRMSHFF